MTKPPRRDRLSLLHNWGLVLCDVLAQAMTLLTCWYNWSPLSWASLTSALADFLSTWVVLFSRDIPQVLLLTFWAFLLHWHLPDFLLWSSRKSLVAGIQWHLTKLKRKKEKERRKQINKGSQHFQEGTKWLHFSWKSKVRLLLQQVRSMGWVRRYLCGTPVGGRSVAVFTDALYQKLCFVLVCSSDFIFCSLNSLVCMCGGGVGEGGCLVVFVLFFLPYSFPPLKLVVILWFQGMNELQGAKYIPRKCIKSKLLIQGNFLVT